MVARVSSRWLLLGALVPQFQASSAAAGSSPSPEKNHNDGDSSGDRSGARDWMKAPEEQRKRETHQGFFGRTTLGVGAGRVWGGSLGPKPGFKPIASLDHLGPAFSLAGQLGYGRGDLAFAVEGLYETLLNSTAPPSAVSFQLIGLGLSGNLYSDEDFHLGVSARWLGMILWRDEVPCFSDRGDWTSGPGIGLTLGKEWFGGDSRGIGIALLGNYARFRGVPKLHYASAQLALSLTTF